MNPSSNYIKFFILFFVIFSFSILTTANVAEAQNLTWDVAPAGSGSVMVDPPGPYTDGQTVTITAIPNFDHLFTGWSGAVISYNSPEQITISGDMHVTANFELMVTYNLTLNASPPEGGSVSYPGPYPEGAPVTITATPNSGYEFDYWSGPIGAADQYSSSITIYMDADKTITANFKTLPAAETITMPYAPTGPASVEKN